MISALFFCALRAPGRRSRPGLPHLLCDSARGGPPFRCGETSGLHYRAAAAAYLPARFFRRKNGDTNTQDTKAAVRGATLRGFAKQTEKGKTMSGASLLASVFVSPFSTNCRVNHAVNFQYQTQVLWYFLDARKYRPPRLLTVQPLQTPQRTPDTSTCRKPLRSRRAQPAAAQDRFPAESEGSCPSRWRRCGKEPRC